MLCAILLPLIIGVMRGQAYSNAFPDFTNRKPIKKPERLAPVFLLLH